MMFDMRLLQLGLLLTIVFASVSARASTTDDHRALMIAGQVMRIDAKLLRARDILATCRDAPCDDDNAECEDIRRYCGTKSSEISAEIPSVVVRIQDDRGLPLHATLRVDATIVEVQPILELDPGHHALRATYAGSTGTFEVDLAKGQRSVPATIVLDLRRTMSARPLPSTVPIFGALTTLASVTAIGFGIAAEIESSNLAFCKPACDPSHKDSFVATTVTVDAALVVAAVSGLATLISYLTRPTRTHVVHVDERVGP